MTPLFSDFSLASKLALRARLLPFTGWMLFALILAVMLAAQFSGRQPATVALDIGLSVIRLALPLLIVLLAQELFSREFDRRYYLSSLAYPRARARFLFGRIAAIYLLTLVVLALLTLVLAGLTALVAQGYSQSTPVSLGGPYLLTLLFIAIDLLVLTAVATLLALVAVTPSFVLVGSYGFLLIARSYSAVISLLAHEKGLVSDADRYQGGLMVLNYLLPDLGALDIRAVTLYGKLELLPQDWRFSVAGALAYSVVLLVLSTWVIRRKRFN